MLCMCLDGSAAASVTDMVKTARPELDPHLVYGLFFCCALCRGVCVCLVKHMCTEVCAGPLPLASSALGCVLQASSMCAPILMLEDVVRHQAVLMSLRATEVVT